MNGQYPQGSRCLGTTTVQCLVEGTLSAEKRAAALAHIDGCDICQALVAALAQTSHGTSATLPAASAEPSGPDHGPTETAESGDLLGLSVGDRVDQFRVVRRLGHGGMGEVFLARDTRLGRKVALKVIRRDALGSAEAAERFVVEARATARFSHPNIVTIYAVGEHHGRPYMALEYLRGQSLRRRLVQDRIGPLQAARLILPVALAVGEAHSHGVLHRDLSPGNVFICLDGRVCVLDFGLAGVRQGDDPLVSLQTSADLSLLARQEQTRGLLGTPTAMAPEQWREGTVGEAADIWAMGVLLYQMVAGHHPFVSEHAESLWELGARVSSDDPTPALPEHPATPEALRRLVTRCLNKAPTGRPSAAEVVEALRRIVRPQDATLPRNTPPFCGAAPVRGDRAGSFRGRESELSEFIEIFRTTPRILLCAPAGWGKTSFIEAGLLPRLKELGETRVIPLRLDDRPLRALRRGLDAAWGDGQSDDARQEDPDQAGLEQAGGRVVLLVDPLDALYRPDVDPEKRRELLRTIWRASDDPDDPLRVLLALDRGRLPDLAADLAPEQPGKVLPLRRPTDESLRAMLRDSLNHTDYSWEDPELVDQIVVQVAVAASPLSTMQLLGEALWEARDRSARRLTRAALGAVGGAAGVLAARGDPLLDTLDARARDIGLDLLLRLCGAGGGQGRTLTRAALLDGFVPAAGEVLDRLLRARVVAEDHRGELLPSHPDLAKNWPQLQRHRRRAGRELAVVEELEQAADLWERRGRSDAELWGGAALNDAQRAVARTRAAPAAGVSRFVAASGRRQEQLAQRRRRRIAAVAVCLALALVGAMVAAVAYDRKADEAVVQRRAAERQRERAQERWAEAHREGARAALERGDLLEARARLRGSLELADAPLARLLWWRLRDDPLVGRKVLPDTIYDVAFSPDGRTVAAAAQNASVYLIDARTLATRTVRGHNEQIQAVAFSPDGRRLASGAYDGKILISPASGQPASPRAQPWKAHSSSARALAFFPDSVRLVSGGGDGLVKVWNTARSRLLHSFKGHKGRVYDVAVSPNGELIASAGQDKTVRLWPTAGGSATVLRGHESFVYTVRFAPDSATVASGGRDRTIRLWRATDGSPGSVLRGHSDRVYALAFSPDGRWLVSGSWDHTVRRWDLSTGKVAAVLRGHSATVGGVAISPDSATVASGGYDRTVRLWRMDRRPRPSPQQAHGDGVNSLAFAADGDTLVSAGLDGTARLWDVTSGRHLGRITVTDDRLFAAAISVTNRELLLAGSGRVVSRWNLQSHRRTGDLSGHLSSVYQLALSPDGLWAASAGKDRTVRLWDLKRGWPRATLTHKGPVLGVAISPDGKRVATAGWDHHVRLWDSDKNKLIQVFRGHTGMVFGVAFTPDGRTLVSGGTDKQLRAWDLTHGTGRLLATLAGRVHWLDISPDGRLVGAPLSDGTAQLVPLAGGPTLALSRHGGEVNHLRFHPGGELVATSGDDGTVRLWDVASGRPRWSTSLMVPPGPHGPAGLITHRGWVPAIPNSEQAPAAAPSWSRGLAQHIQTGAASPDGSLLCLARQDGAVELLSPTDRTRGRTFAAVQADAVMATQKGCAALGRGSLHWLPLVGRASVKANGAQVLGTAPDGFVALGNGRWTRHLADGRVTASGQADAEASAVLFDSHGARWFGFGDGAVEGTAPAGKTGAATILRNTPASAVIRLLQGPGRTLLAGYVDGTFGIWDRRGGALLHRSQLHGRIRFMQVNHGTWWVATELGQHQRIDLSLLTTPWCELLRRVRREVPVTWHGGAAHLASRSSPRCEPMVHGQSTN